MEDKNDNTKASEFTIVKSYIDKYTDLLEIIVEYTDYNLTVIEDNSSERIYKLFEKYTEIKDIEPINVIEDELFKINMYYLQKFLRDTFDRNESDRAKAEKLEEEYNKLNDANIKDINKLLYDLDNFFDSHIHAVNMMKKDIKNCISGCDKCPKKINEYGKLYCIDLVYLLSTISNNFKDINSVMIESTGLTNAKLSSIFLELLIDSRCVDINTLLELYYEIDKTDYKPVENIHISLPESSKSNEYITYHMPIPIKDSKYYTIIILNSTFSRIQKLRIEFSDAIGNIAKGANFDNLWRAALEKILIKYDFIEALERMKNFENLTFEEISDDEIVIFDTDFTIKESQKPFNVQIEASKGTINTFLDEISTYDSLDKKTLKILFSKYNFDEALDLLEGDIVIRLLDVLSDTYIDKGKIIDIFNHYGIDASELL